MKRVILSTALLYSTTLWAGFNFGQECSGSGTFSQHIEAYGRDTENAVLVGYIPQGIQGLNVTLKSNKNVDIRLYGELNDKIVHWPNGILNEGDKETKVYKGVNVTYSGYDGTDGKKGHEFIRIDGSTPTSMEMKAFGYQEGDATINYTWSGKDGCTPNNTDSGSGHFTQKIPHENIAIVGDIPKGISNFEVSLKSDKDIDIQLYGEDGTAIIAWPSGILNGSGKQTTTYHGMTIEWSGYAGTGGKNGHEYIKVSGKTTEKITMKVYGFKAGIADVDYSWGEKDIDTTPPVISLNGKGTVVITVGSHYTEDGATAYDEKDGNIAVDISGNVNINRIGLYTVKYTATDHADNKSELIRTVKVTSTLDDDDDRAYQHGIDFVKISPNKYILMWASSGIVPSGSDTNGNWTHDIYYTYIDTNKPQLTPKKIISAPGAQEPLSAAISSNKHIMITMEDSYNAVNGLAQTYGVYDTQMHPINKYQKIVYDGGHSGHTTSVGNNFVVFYSDEWIDGGGVNDLGSGDDVLLKVYDSEGKYLYKKDVAVGDETRDWWPMVAGSSNRALVLWQRFVEDKTHAKLMYKILNINTRHWETHEITLLENLKYYTYDVQYIKALNRFLISGTDKNNKGFLFLLSTTGEVIAQNTSLPPMVREAQPAIWDKGNGEIKVVYPIKEHNLLALTMTASHISVKHEISVSTSWSYGGVDGIFLNENDVYFVALSPTGTNEITVNVGF